MFAIQRNAMSIAHHLIHLAHLMLENSCTKILKLLLHALHSSSIVSIHLLTSFHLNKICLCVIEWINDGDIFRIKCSQPSSSMHKKPLIDWLIYNQWLRRQANSNLDSNHGLRISRINDRMNNRAAKRTNEDWLKIEWVSAGSKRLIWELELVNGTLLIDVKQTKLPKHTTGQKLHGFWIMSMVI